MALTARRLWPVFRGVYVLAAAIHRDPLSIWFGTTRAQVAAVHVAQATPARATALLEQQTITSKLLHCTARTSTPSDTPNKTEQRRLGKSGNKPTSVWKLTTIFEGKAKASPAEVLELVLRTHSSLPRLQLHSLRQFVWCLSQFLKKNAATSASPGALQQLMEPVTEQLQKLNLADCLSSSDVAQLVLDLAHCGYLPRHVCDSAASAVMKPEAKPKYLTKSAWAFARAGHDPLDGKFFDFVLSKLDTPEELQKVGTRELVQLVWSLPTVGRLDHFKQRPSLWKDVVTKFHKGLHECREQDVSNFMWSAAKCELNLPVPVLDDVCRLVETKHVEYTEQGFENVLWAFARQRYVPRSAAYLSCFAQRFDRMVRRKIVGSRDCTQYLYSAALLRLPVPADALDSLLSPLSQQPNVLLSYQTPEHAVLIHVLLYSLALIGHPIRPPVLRAFGEYLVAALDQGLLDEKNFGQLSLVLKTVGCGTNWFHEDVVARIRQPPPLRDEETSKFQRGVLKALVALGYRCSAEHDVDNHPVDIALLECGKVAVEADGPQHFSLNAPYVLLGEAVLRNKILASAGWTMVCVPFHEWDNQSSASCAAYLTAKLRKHGVEARRS